MTTSDDTTRGSSIPEPHESPRAGVTPIPANLAETYRKEIPDDQHQPQVGATADQTIYRRLGIPATETNTDGKRYRIGTEIGRGANGRVCGAFDSDLQRSVAVKYLAGEHRDVSGFINEAQITASLEHPNIPPIYDLNIAADGALFFTQRRVHGSSLGQRLREAIEKKHLPPLPVNDTITIILKICDALAFAHDRGVIHRDIKPENIMVGNFGDVVVIDWGTATSSGAGSDGLVGTPMYMSPEQARNETVSAQSDIYAVGACLFHMLFGRGPIRTDNHAAFWQAKRAGDIEKPTALEMKRIPPQLVAITMKALAGKTADRYQNISDFSADLKRFQAGQSVSVYADNVVLLFWHWLCRNRAKASVFAGFFVVIVIIASLMTWQYRQQNAPWIALADIVTTRETPASFDRDWKILTAALSGEYIEQELKTTDNNYLETTTSGFIIRSRYLRYTNLVLRNEIAGGVRVSWEAKPLKRNLDMNVFIGSGNRRDGFHFSIGGLNNPCYFACSTSGGLLIYDSNYQKSPLRLNEFHKFTIERDRGQVKLWINGDLILNIPDLLTERGNNLTQFGFDCIQGNDYEVRHIQFEQKPPALLVPALDIGERLFINEQWGAALQQYKLINFAYPDTDSAKRAQLRIGQILLRKGEETTGLEAIQQFAEKNPDHTWAAQAWYDIFLYASEHGDDDLANRSIAALKSLKAHFWLRIIVSHLAEKEALRFPFLYDFNLNNPEKQRLDWDLMKGSAYKLYELQKQMGISVIETNFTQRGLDYFLNSGNAQLVLDTYPYNSAAQGFSLIELGRYEEALKRFHYIAEIVVRARIYSGRYDEIIAENPMEINQVNALIAKEDFATLRKKYPNHYRTSEWRILRGESVELIKEMPEDKQLVMRALTALGKAKEALNISESGVGATYAYMALGQPEEILAYANSDVADVHCALIGFAQKGDHDSFHKLLSELEKTEVHLYQAANIRVMFFHSVILPFIQTRLDQQFDLRAGLSHALQEGSQVTGGRCAISAQFMLGDIDEKTMLAQPNKRNLALYSKVTKAMHAELNNDLSAAHMLYASCLTSPDITGSAERALYHFVVWREQVTSELKATTPQ